MRVLLLRTDTDRAELYLYQDGCQADCTIWNAGRQLAETINVEIQQLITRQDLVLDDLNGLVIYTGPGSFTGLRIGHSIANALADSLNIPIVGANGRDWIGQGLSRLDKGENDRLVLPDYGAPVHTTRPRK